MSSDYEHTAKLAGMMVNGWLRTCTVGQWIEIDINKSMHVHGVYMSVAQVGLLRALGAVVGRREG